MITTKKLRMDLTAYTGSETVYAVQSDRYSRNLEISVYSDGDAWNIPEGICVIIRYGKPDGTGGEYNTMPDGSSAWSASENILTVALAPQVLTVPGPVTLSVILLQEHIQISTFSMIINVKPVANIEIDKSEDYHNIPDFLPAPATAEPGQYFRVSSVDDSGHVTQVEAVNLESSSGMQDVAAHNNADDAHPDIRQQLEEKVGASSQTFTNEEKAQIRANIGAVSPDEVVVNTVSWENVSFEWADYTNYAIVSNGTIGYVDTGVEDYGWAKIPVSTGDTYRISTMHYWGSFGYALVDDNDNVLLSDGYADDAETKFTGEFTVQAGQTYLYVNRHGFTTLQKQFISGATVKSISKILAGKKIVYDGDSICSGAGDPGGYAKIIAGLTSGTYDNQAAGAGHLRSGITDCHCIADNLANLPADGDLYCFQGGINDYWDNAALGSYTLNDFTGDVDATTVCGALETIFRYALNNFPGKPVCFVITHKIQNTAYAANTAGNTFQDYRDAMAAICEKYSIAYYDAFSESGLNGWNEVQSNLYLTGNSDGTADGCHPNEEGYKRYYVPQLMALFEKIMPVV